MFENIGKVDKVTVTAVKMKKRKKFFAQTKEFSGVLLIDRPGVAGAVLQTASS